MTGQAASGGALGPRSSTVRRLRRLSGRRSARYEEQLIVVEGRVLLEEACAAGWAVVDCVISDSIDDRAGVADRCGVEPIVVTDAAIAAIATTDTPQPVIATVAVPQRGIPNDGAIVVLDRIGDPGNLGTMIRSAEAAGMAAVVVTPGTTDWTSPKVVRSSAGGVFHMPVVVGALDELREAGWRLIGTSSHRGVDHRTMLPGPQDAIVIGNEAHGLDDDAPVHEWVTITHRGRAESLNAAMAATLVCFSWGERMASDDSR